MDKKYFKLNVSVGTQIISSRGDYVVEDIPDNAFEYYQNGSTWLGLTEDSVSGLLKLPEATLSSLLLLKERQEIEQDVLILKKAIQQKANATESESSSRESLSTKKKDKK